MRTTLLGDGLTTSAIGFGGMALSHIYGGIDDESALATLNACLDAGVTFIDTADVYGNPRPGVPGPAGTNEELIARLLDNRRAEVQLATKFGITGAIGITTATRRTRGDAAYVHQACEASLRRLGVDEIDLYYLHRRDPEVPIGETVAAMAELVTSGKVLHLGLSEVTADELREAHAVHPITAVQSEWSVWSRDVEDQVVPTCAELGVGFVPYAPLGRGFLTGTLTPEQVATDFRGQTARIGAGWEANQAALRVVQPIAERHRGTNAQVVLAWLYASGARFGLPVVPIPGTRNPARVRENAVELTLTEADIAELDGIINLVSGGRNIVEDPTWISAGREQNVRLEAP